MGISQRVQTTREMKGFVFFMVLAAFATAELVSEDWREDDKITTAYLKMQANEKMISNFIPDMHNDFGENREVLLQEEAKAPQKKIPTWVSSESDLEAFLQEEHLAGKKIVRKVTGVPETTLEASSSQSPFDAATSKVSTMLQVDSMARRSACVKAADASINNVFTDVKNSQRMLNKLPNGRHCATRNQHLINRAKRTIRTRTNQVRSAVNHLRKQRRSRVRWNFSYESLRENSCSAFYRSGQWQTAKRRVHHANRRLISARANLRAARNNLKVQIRNAKRARNRCRCAIKRRVARELKSAKRLTGDRMKTLLREMMVKCLVSARKRGKNANKYAARCKNLRVSASYKRRLRLFRTRLAPGVAAARCNKRSNVRYSGRAWCETFHTCRGGDKRNFWAWVKKQGYKMYKGACSARKNTRTYGRRHRYWGGRFTFAQCKAKCDRMGRSCEGITMPSSIRRVRL